ncbi:MAG: hypothetical protein ABIT83_07850, partial [Massilia sp.]
MAARSASAVVPMPPWWIRRQPGGDDFQARAQGAAQVGLGQRQRVHQQQAGPLALQRGDEGRQLRHAFAGGAPYHAETAQGMPEV